MSQVVNKTAAISEMLGVLLPMWDAGHFADVEDGDLLALSSAFEAALRERGVIASDERLSVADMMRLIDALMSNEHQHLGALQDRLKDQTAQLDPS